VAGGTKSANFPLTADAYQRTPGGDLDAFVTVFTSDLSGHVYSSRLGGSSTDFARTVGLDAAGQVLIAGNTKSGNFPVASGAPDPTFGGVTDGFVSRLRLVAGPPPPPDPCVVDPLLPVVSVTAPGHTVTWTLAGTITVTDERTCTVQVTQ
jgi:hypothetical protein